MTAREEPVATAIARLQGAVSKIKATTGLNERAILVLLVDMTKLPKKTVQAVLDGQSELFERYCVGGLSRDELDCVRLDDKLQAIKLYRKRTGVTLAAAKQAVEAAMERL